MSTVLHRRSVVQLGWSLVAALLPLLLVAGAAVAQPTAWQLVDDGDPDPGYQLMEYRPATGSMLLYDGTTQDGAAAYLWELGAEGWDRMFLGGLQPRGVYGCAGFDEARDVLVVTQGSVGETWEFDGSSWVEVVTAHAPSARSFCQMVYDSHRERLVLFGGSTSSASYFNDTWEYDGTDWTQVLTQDSPTPRVEAGMAFDRSRGVVVLYGGRQTHPTFFSDTWEFDGSNWTWRQTGPAPDPGQRYGAGMIYDAGRGRTVLFGGSISIALLNDTWEWDGSAWQQVVLEQRPSPRWSFRLGYDPTEGRVIGFGGNRSEGWFNDTWSYDGSGWVPIDTGTRPDARRPDGMTVDAGQNAIVVFGGSSGVQGGQVADTWVYDSAGWREDSGAGEPAFSNFPVTYDGVYDRVVGYSGSSLAQYFYLHEYRGDPRQWSSDAPQTPRSRDQHSWVYAPALGGVLLFGGRVDDFAEPLPNDTWILDGETWRELEPVESPTPPRKAAAAAYDSLRGHVYLYGGEATFPSGDLADFWRFDGISWLLIDVSIPPGVRAAGAQLAYDSKRDRLILFGSGPVDEGVTWEWDGLTWSALPTPFQPDPNRGWVGLAYSQADEVIYLFGGRTPYNANYFDDLWAYGLDLDSDGFVGKLDNCGSTPNPAQLNGDGDEAGDLCDCAPQDPGAFSIPAPVEGLAVGSDKQTLSWESAGTSAGADTVHDLLRGRVDELPVGSSSFEDCLVSGTLSDRYTDPFQPPAGTSFWYLVRGKNLCGVGNYGSSSLGLERQSSACD